MTRTRQIPLRTVFANTVRNRLSYTVGYGGNDLNSGNKRILITPQFATIGNAEKQIRIGDIKPVSSATVGNRRITIYTLTDGGKTDQTYIWNGSNWTHNSKDASNEYFPAGKGLWVYCQMTAGTVVNLQGSGEVSKEDIVVRLVGGNKRTACGNGFPMAVKFKNIIPEAVTQGQLIGNRRITIYTLTDGGKTDQTYIWNGSNWTHNSVDASEEDLPAGKGLWVYCQVPVATTLVDLRIKSPVKDL